MLKCADITVVSRNIIEVIVIVYLTRNYLMFFFFFTFRKQMSVFRNFILGIK